MLLSNSAQQNNILTAQVNLKERLDAIRQDIEARILKNKNEGKDVDSLVISRHATYSQVLKSHVFPVISSYKPFVSLGHEYDIIRSPEGVLEWGTQVKFKMRNHGEFISDAVLHVKISSARTADFRDKFKYCEFPGHRMMKRVYHRMNNSLIDQYDSETYNQHYAFWLPDYKKTGWKRNMGQEVPKSAYLVGEPGVDEKREIRWITDGLQTSKRTQPAFEMWIPLMFWYQDPKQAIPVIAMKDGSNEVTIELESLSNMIATTNFGGGGAMDNARLPTITQLSLYVNHIYVSEDIHDLLRDRFHFMLLRVHQTQYKDITTSLGQINQLSELRYPIESLTFAATPLSNLAVVDLWNKKTNLTQQTHQVPVIISTPVDGTLSSNVAIYYNEADMFDELTIKVSGVELYVNIPISFFSNYMPSKQNNRVATPEDKGWCLLTFNIDAGEYQPTGYLDLSTSRELVIQYVSSVISPANPARFVIIARAINFLIIENETVKLKYIS